MVEFAPEVWLGLAGVGLAMVVAVLYVLASVVRTEAHIHDLRIEVAQARNAYLRDLYGQSGDGVGEMDEPIDVEIVGEGPGAVSEEARRAA